MNTCINCFKSDHLRQYISSFKVIGDCDFCDSQNIQIVHVSELGKIFVPIVKGFRYIPLPPAEMEHRNMLAYYMQTFLQLFNDELLDTTDQNVLLDQIRKDEKEDLFDDPFGEWNPSEIANILINNRDRWWGFTYHLKFKRRFVLDISQDKVNSLLNYIKDLLPVTEVTLDEETIVYRARLGHENGEAYPVDKMGAPPAEIASAGRANSVGIPYLYLASTEETALSEVRPWKGAYVSVAKFKILKNLKVVDLTKGYQINFLEKDMDIFSEYEKQDFIEMLNEELATPVDPSQSNIEYTPTQYLAELIISQNYDGIIFKSAMGEGKNIVLFDPLSAKAEKVSIFKVKDVKYTYESR